MLCQQRPRHLLVNRKILARMEAHVTAMETEVTRATVLKDTQATIVKYVSCYYFSPHFETVVAGVFFK